jgi:hypothetical protein
VAGIQISVHDDHDDQHDKRYYNERKFRFGEAAGCKVLLHVGGSGGETGQFVVRERWNGVAHLFRIVVRIADRAIGLRAAEEVGNGLDVLLAGDC